jgi:hypothetical protein
LEKNLFFVVIFKATDKKSRIRIRHLVEQIRGSRSISKRCGSGTLTVTCIHKKC